MKKKRKLPKILLVLVIVIVLLWGCVSLMDDEEYDDSDTSSEEISENTDDYYDEADDTSDNSAEATSDETSDNVSDAGERDWNIYVVDASGQGIADVKVQFCTDTICTTVDSDSDGFVAFDGDAEQYEVHLLRIPDGYEYKAGDVTAFKGESLEIILDAAEEELSLTRTDVKLSFSSTDLDGNPIDDSIFTQNKVTIVNMWEPWCGPCLMEMPDLDKLYREYSDWGLMVIGVHADNDDLQSVLQETGVTYPIINSTSTFNNIVSTTGSYPTSVFVDSEGYLVEVMGEVYFDGYQSYDTWKDLIESLK